MRIPYDDSEQMKLVHNVPPGQIVTYCYNKCGVIAVVIPDPPAKRKRAKRKPAKTTVDPGH